MVTERRWERGGSKREGKKRGTKEERARERERQTLWGREREEREKRREEQSRERESSRERRRRRRTRAQNKTETHINLKVSENETGTGIQNLITEHSSCFVTSLMAKHRKGGSLRNCSCHQRLITRAGRALHSLSLYIYSLLSLLSGSRGPGTEPEST